MWNEHYKKTEINDINIKNMLCVMERKTSKNKFKYIDEVEKKIMYFGFKIYNYITGFDR
jgi:formylmethanofuran dehydrogenase subunit A